MKHDDGTDGHNYRCKKCGARVSEYGCVRIMFPQPNSQDRASAQQIGRIDRSNPNQAKP